MRPTPLSSMLLTACLASLLYTTPALAQTGQAKAATTATQADPTAVYGSQLMTERERTAFRARLWAAQTDEERNRIRAEHHEDMKQRAQAKGLTLPDAPPPMRGMTGMGMGGGPMGRGMMAGAPCPAASSAASAPPCDGTRRGMGRHHRRGGGPMNRP